MDCLSIVSIKYDNCFSNCFGVFKSMLVGMTLSQKLVFCFFFVIAKKMHDRRLYGKKLKNFVWHNLILQKKYAAAAALWFS